MLVSRSKGSRFCRLGCLGSRRVQGLGACFRFKVEGFEVWSAGNFFEIKGFEVFACVLDSRSKGSRFSRLGYTDPP